jgi:murein DD-endopeptidase MepM/ murein hydrolase activator NlpD
VSYALPLDGEPDVARRFERPAQRWSAGHRGVDLRASEGAVARAPADGVVTFAGAVAGRGVVTVTHPDGRRSSLEPVSPSVVVGTIVELGQQVGTVQAAPSHCAPAVCLHWGVRVGADYEDPWALLPGAGPVVLLSSGP